MNDSCAINGAKNMIGNSVSAQSIRTRRIEDSGHQAPESKDTLLIEESINSITITRIEGVVLIWR